MNLAVGTRYVIYDTEGVLAPLEGQRLRVITVPIAVRRETTFLAVGELFKKLHTRIFLKDVPI